MSVKKKVNSSVASFIDKGAAVKTTKEKSFKNILIRVPETILQAVDAEIEKKPWLTRTQWIVEAMHEKLKKEE